VRFLIVTHLIHKRNSESEVGGYAPYIREMNLWTVNVSEVKIVAPIKNEEFESIDLPYDALSKLSFTSVPLFKITEPIATLKAIVLMPLILLRTLNAMIWADHIHLRCPGNMGLVGVAVQIFFPFKTKTAKYAGNWGENLGQPWSYRFQKWILRNTFLTRNMRVLVYGDWPHQSKNIVPFFTASYSEAEIVPVKQRDMRGVIYLVFVGTLMKSKNPLTTVQVAAALWRKGVPVHLQLLGDGPERNALQTYVEENALQSIVSIRGNVTSEVVKQVLQESHFLVFLSNSEGWPKAVAEAMFWGCVPLTRPVSCVPWMLQEGDRGILAKTMDAEVLADDLYNLIRNSGCYHEMSSAAAVWSRKYTLEKFKEAIQAFI